MLKTLISSKGRPIPPALQPASAWRQQLHKNYLNSWTIRKQWTDICWFIPTHEVVSELAKQLGRQSVVEAAAGTGYLAHHLRVRGVSNLVAVDNRSRHFTNDAPNFGTLTADAIEVLQLRPSTQVLLMTWPAYATDFATRMVEHLQPGAWLYYQGEYCACCADDVFFEVIQNPDFFVFERTLTDRLNEHNVQFEGIRDEWGVYRRTNRSNAELGAYITQLYAEAEAEQRRRDERDAAEALEEAEDDANAKGVICHVIPDNDVVVFTP